LEYIPLYQRKGEKPFLLEGGSMLLLANWLEKKEHSRGLRAVLSNSHHTVSSNVAVNWH
jgi:hypothetical protein